MPEPEIRRLPAALDAPLARLEDARDELAKAWLLRLLERVSLDEIERLPTDRLARELPPLIAAILRAVGTVGIEGPAVAEDTSAHAVRLAELRGGEAVSAADLAGDLAALQSVLIAALRRELEEDEPHLFADAVERLAAVFSRIQAAATEELLGRRERELELLANTDPLTGLYNVRFLQELLRQLVDVHRRYGYPFSVLLLDINGLKRLNDSRGHAAGDRALIAVANAIRSSIRRVDTPVRIGGDEFCVIAPHQTATRARAIGERIAEAVDAMSGRDEEAISVAIGVSACPQHAIDAERLLELGDEAMYRAKASGQPVTIAMAEDPPTAVENGM